MLLPTHETDPTFANLHLLRWMLVMFELIRNHVCEELDVIEKVTWEVLDEMGCLTIFVTVVLR